MDRGQQNAENLPKVKNGKSIQLIDDASRLSAEDRLIFRGIEDALRQAGIQIVERPDQISADNVLVLTGSKDRTFREFILDLHRNGHLRNRLVVLLSCGDGNDASFLSQMLSADNGPRGFLYFRDQIDPLTVQAVLEDFANRMNKVENPANFRQLFLDSVEETYRNVRARSPQVEEDFRRLRRCLIQVSQSTRAPERQITG